LTPYRASLSYAYKVGRSYPVGIFFFFFFSYSQDFIFFQLFWLSTKCWEQSNILEKQNGKRVCVKDEWRCLLLLYIIISLFCLSKCKMYLIKKAEKRISSLYESNKQKILWLVENIL
jgi:hypothetical protein